MGIKELALVLNRVLELHSCEFDYPEDHRQTIESDKYIKEQGFTFDKLSELIEGLK